MRRRQFLVLPAAVAAMTGLGGCSPSEPALSSVEPRLTADVLTIPGVTGGHVQLYEASMTPRAVLQLTGSASTREELIATLDRVLAALTGHIRPYRLGNASVSLTSGDLVADQTSLGLSAVVSFDELRQRYP